MESALRLIIEVARETPLPNIELLAQPNVWFGLVLGFVTLWYLLQYPTDLAIEATATTLLEAVDGGDDEVGDCIAERGEGVGVVDVNKANFVGAVVRAAKAEFGLMEDEPANRRVVHRFMYDMMVGRGMRPTHIHRFLPMCVELAFVPDSVELEAKLVRQSRVVKDRQAAMVAARRFEQLGAVLGWRGWLYYRLPTPWDRQQPVAAGPGDNA